MLALYRSGRQAEALEVYREARRVLSTRSASSPGPSCGACTAACCARTRRSSSSRAPTELPRELDADRAPPLVGRDARARAAARALGARRGPAPAPRRGRRRARDRQDPARRRAGRRGPSPRRRGACPPAATARRRVLGRAGRSSRRRTRPTLLVARRRRRARPPRCAPSCASGCGQPRAVRCSSSSTGDDAERSADVGADDALVLEPLDVDAVRAIARLTRPRTRRRSRRRVAARRQRRRAAPRARARRPSGRGARRRAGSSAVAERTAAGRAELRSMEAELAGGVIDAAGRAASASPDRRTPATRRCVCPFKGLASFDVADAPYFFGRERLVAELVARLVGAPLLGVVGPSGSGKSSVVRAGLLPALAGGVLPGSEDWAQVRHAPGRASAARARDAAAGIGRDGRVRARRRPVRGDLHGLPRRGASARAFVAELVAPAAADAASSCSRSAPTTTGAAPPTRSCRRLLAAHHVLVGAMRRDELRRAVERPARARRPARRAGAHRRAGGRRRARAGRAAAALDRAARALAAARRAPAAPGRLRGAPGGVRGAVARHAEDAFARLDADAAGRRARRALRLAAEGGARRGRAPARRARRARRARGRPPTSSRVLTDQRLLTVSAGAVELAHEALLREWPRLRGWLEEDAEGRRIHRRLRRRARVARARARRRTRCTAARASPRRSSGGAGAHGLTSCEREFLAASDALRPPPPHRAPPAASRSRSGRCSSRSSRSRWSPSWRSTSATNADARNIALSRQLGLESERLSQLGPRTRRAALAHRPRHVADRRGRGARCARRPRRSIRYTEIKADSVRASTAAFTPTARAVTAGCRRRGDRCGTLRHSGGRSAAGEARRGEGGSLLALSGDRIALGFADGTVLVTDQSLEAPHAAARGIGQGGRERWRSAATGASSRLDRATARCTCSRQTSGRDETFSGGQGAVHGVDLNAAGTQIASAG